MKWFDKWFYRKVRWVLDRARQEYPEIGAEQDCLADLALRKEQDCFPTAVDTPAICSSSGEVNMDNSIRFNVLPCHGGLVLEVRVYDRKTHDTNIKTYLIPEGEPIADRIGQYVTMEMMQR